MYSEVDIAGGPSGALDTPESVIECRISTIWRFGMADNVVATGKSIYEVSVQMAETILIDIEQKAWDRIGRAEYLKTVYQCMDVS
jgi:hypothetical protein